MDKTNEKTSQSWVMPDLLTRSEVAQLLHVSLSYVDHLPDLPCYKLGKKKLFEKTEILNFLKENHVMPVSKTISKTDEINSKEDADE